MHTVYILVGVPGSGKTTWLKDNPKTKHADILSSDGIIEDIASEYGYTYNDIFKEVVPFANRVFLDSVDLAVKEHDCDVVLDRTNMSRKTRAPFIRKFKGFRKVAVVFEKPSDEEWLRRLNSRPDKTIPKYILDSMVGNFEMPTELEGFDEIIPVMVGE
jgi:tRNA uridine 5-carbamoylmethylation protein Kti12